MYILSHHPNSLI